MTSIVALLYLWTLYSICSPLPQFKQSHNTLFIDQGDIHTSAHSWSISFHINITDFAVTATTLTQRIHGYLMMFRSLDPINIPMDNNIRDAYIDLLMHEYSALVNVLTDTQHLSNQIQNLSRLCISDCQTQRHRRSILPVVSSIFEVLFGFATRHKQELIENQLAIMNRNNYQIMHAVEHAITVLDKTSMAVKQNRDMLNNLTDVMSQMSSDLAETSVFINTSIIPFQQVMFRAKQLSVTKSAFQHAYLQLQNAVNELLNQISHLFQGHISVSILPPSMLRYILRTIKFRMPSGLSLPYDPNGDLAPYYKLFSVHVKSADVGFLATATIPIYDSTSSFTVYKSVHVPIFLNINETYVHATAVYDDDTSYFALSEDSNRIIFLDEAVISFCMSQELHFCYINSATFQVAQLSNNCIIDLFFDSPNVNFSCHTEISPRSGHDPISTFLSLNTWSISTTTPISFTFLCKNGSSKFLVRPPMTVLRLPPGCDASSSSLSLVNQIPFESDISLPPFKINLTALTFIWKPLHISLSNYHNSNNLKIPSKLESLVLSHTSIPSLVNAFEPMLQQRSHTWIIILILLLVIALLSIYPTYRIIKYVKCFNRTRIINANNPLNTMTLNSPSADNPIESHNGLSLS